MLAGLLAMALTAVPAPVVSTSEQGLVESFVAALQSGSSTSFAPLSDSGAIDGPAWESLRDTLERFHGEKVSSYHAAPALLAGERVVEIELTGFGIRNNAAQAQRPLPARWYLRTGTSAGALRLLGAETGSHAWMRELVAASDDTAREAILSREPASELLAALPGLAYSTAVARWGSPDAKQWAAYRATATFLQARAVALQDDRLAVWAGILMGITLSDDDKGTRALAAAASLAARIGDRDAAALAEHTNAFRGHMADPPRAIALEAQAGAAIDALDDPRIAMRARSNFSLWQERAGQSREALLAAESLARDAARFRWRSGEGFAHVRLGDIFADLGQTASAVDHYRRAAVVLHDAGAIGDEAIELATLASLDIAAGRLAQGLVEHARAVALGRPRLNDWYLNQYVLTGPVEALLAHGRVAEAAALLPPTVTAPASGLATAEVRLAQGQPREALTVLQALLPTDDPTQIWKARFLEARAQRRLGMNAEAEASLRDAVDFIEQRRRSLAADEATRALLLDDKLAVFRELVTLLVDAGRAADALAVVERMRAQSLQESLAQGHVGPLDLSAEEQQRERDLDRTLTDLNGQLLHARGDVAVGLRERLAAAREERERFRTELYVRHPRAASRLVPTLDPLAAAATLPPRALVVELAVLEREVLAFTVRRGATGQAEVAFRRLQIDQPTLQRRVERFAAALERRDLGYGVEARRLGALLVDPLRHWLADTSVLYVVPDGVLWRLPFQVLRDARGRPLVARVAITYAPSLSVLALGRRASTSGSPPGVLLAFADPAVDAAAASRVRALAADLPIGRLPDARAEVAALGRLYPDALVRVGAAAQEGLFKQQAESYRMLHLATHGIVDDRAPMYSALVLAPSPGEDGLLEAREIVDLHLHARLVVLSACDTARGKIGGGEGVIGLSWAFQVAGVPTTVVSQWQANSKATAALMIAFHRHLVAGSSPAAALRRAQVELMRRPAYRHPFYWAPFVIVGVGE